MAAFGQTVFDTYEEEANTSLASFEQELAQSAVYAGNEKAAKLHNAEVLLAQVKDVLDQMAIEVRTVPRKERAPYEQRKAAVQTAYDDAQRKLKKTREDANKAKLLGAGAGAAGGKESASRTGERTDDAA
uniref:Vesicle transport v-SNARE N-terminal domain-containing protein n=1 Tax=Phaeomonas parva TaxID=124430 RepID=A0A7S1XPN4_9STRA|mmetsp:Transcript_22323/g.68873  ORF Transcript_22323/g.68873 Transcript_22323/m.68873 type:complete len:130 (-) Transcript_22323:126-515(-)